MAKARDQQQVWDADQQATVQRRLLALAETVQDMRAEVDSARQRAAACKEDLAQAIEEFENAILGKEDLPRIFDRAQAVTSAEECWRTAKGVLASLKGKLTLARCDLRATATAVRRPLPLFDGKES